MSKIKEKRAKNKGFCCTLTPILQVSNSKSGKRKHFSTILVFLMMFIMGPWIFLFPPPYSFYAKDLRDYFIVPIVLFFFQCVVKIPFHFLLAVTNFFLIVMKMQVLLIPSLSLLFVSHQKTSLKRKLFKVFLYFIHFVSCTSIYIQQRNYIY